jgi:hypothetical protein
MSSFRGAGIAEADAVFHRAWEAKRRELLFEALDGAS